MKKMNLETMKKMLEEWGIKFDEEVYQDISGIHHIITVYGGYAGFSSSLTFVDEKLKSIEVYEQKELLT